MKKAAQILFLLLVALYVVSVISWYVLHLSYGDTLWWLAVLNVIAPHLFIPLPLFLLLALLWRNRYALIMLTMPLCLFIWLYGALFWPNWTKIPDSDRPFTVMTFNIWGPSRSEETAQVIIEEGLPDLVAIQELQPRMAETLLEELSIHYPYHQLDTFWSRNGIGLFSRYPISITGERTFAYLNWEYQALEIQVGDRSFTFFNLHAQSTNVFSLGNDYIPLDYWIAYTYESRLSYLQLLVAEVKKQAGPVIIVGDFNITDQSDAYQLLVSEFNDAHREAGWGFGHTFPARRKRYRQVTIPPKQVRIDMIFYSDHFIALESRVGSTYGESDHRPVIATFAWRE